MKKLIFILTFFTAILCITIVTYCGQENIIRVGLISKFGTVSSVSINSNSLYVGFQKDENFYNCGTITGDNFSVKSGANYYSVGKNTFKTFAEAKNACGENGVPALTDINCWKIYFGGYSSEAEAKANKNGTATKSTENITALISNGKTIALFDNSNYFLQIKESNGNNIKINNEEFRERIEFLKKGNSFSIVNVLDIDKYLYGVLPGEISSSWPKESLKAQAVAARSFSMYTKKGKHSKDGYDLCDSTHCQVYKGVSAETQNTNEAVDETKGVFAYYNGDIIEATYFGSSGGYTADAYDVWGVEIPYLKPVDDLTETGGKVWTRSFSFAELTNIVNDNGENIGTVNKVYINSTDKSGRVNALVIQGTKGDIILEKEKIRTFFAKSKDGSLFSRNFSINKRTENATNISENQTVSVLGNTSDKQVALNNIKTIDVNEKNFDFSNVSKVNVIGANSSKEYDKVLNKTVSQNVLEENVSGDVVFYGKGYGHGVGMSQEGAKSLAEKGFDYVQILKHYYTGIEIK